MGGGSVSDCCKIVAAQVKTEKNLWEMEMMEHQLGAYTDCNHGQGLAVIYPV